MICDLRLHSSIPEYWPISALNTALHRRFISTPRWAMSIFLLKSDGGTPQNMRFNVFVKRVCSIYGEYNIWHAKSWRFTPGSCFPNCAVPRQEFGLAYLGKFMQGRQGQTVPESPRPVHGPWHGLLMSKLIRHMQEASSNVEQTRYPIMTRHVFIPLKIAWEPKKHGFSQWVSNQITANGRCFTVVSVIAECWYMKLRHVKCV